MTGRERFQELLEGRIPDSPPVTLFIQHQGHFISQIRPEVSPFDGPALDRAIAEYQKSLGLNVFIRILFDMDEASAMPREGVDVGKRTDEWEVEFKETTEDTITKKFYVIKTPKGELTQELAVNESRPGTFLHACMEKPIKTREDLELAREFEPTCGDEFRALVKARVDAAKEAVGDSGIVGVWAPNNVFNNAARLIKLDALYCLFLTEPDFFRDLMEFALLRITPYVDTIAESGADVLIVSGNIGGGFMGRQMYDEYLLPYEKRFFANCRKAGIKTLLHNCGEIMNLVESYVNAGVDWVEPFSPPPLGDGNLEAAFEIVKGRYIITGGVDQINVLQRGSVEDVKRATRERLEIGMNSGEPFVLQCADFLEYGTPLENVGAFARTALRMQQSNP